MARRSAADPRQIAAIRRLGDDAIAQSDRAFTHAYQSLD
jgi:hypothetical protein